LSTTYKAGNPPDDLKQLVQFLRSELIKLEESLNDQQDFIEFRVLNTAPTKLREGMEVEADGTNWDPGSGAGKYVYRSGAWVFIG